MTLADKARALAHECYEADSTGYLFNHAARVARLVSEVTTSQAVIASAWLHDVAEDTCVSFDAIPHECRELVMWMTDCDNIQATRHIRKALSRARLRRAPMEARLIKLCDRLDNVRSLKVAQPDFFANVYAAESRELVKALIEGDDTKDAMRKLADEILEVCDATTE